MIGVMDLTPFVEQLRRDLTAAADAGTEQVRAAAGQLMVALDPAARIVLLDALVSAADELTTSSDVVVDVRLRGREVELTLHHVVSPEATAPAPPAPPVAPAPPIDLDEGTARVSLRLPETLKTRAEDAASNEGISLNTWLVRAVGIALDGLALPPVSRRQPRQGKRLSGWATS
jgi:hypothetical protein